MSYVIIGNSTAAIGAVEGIRRYDKDTKITIISDDTVYFTQPAPNTYFFLRVYSFAFNGSQGPIHKYTS